MAKTKTRKQRLLRGMLVTLVILIVFAIMNFVAAKIIYDMIFPRFEYDSYDLAMNIDYKELGEDYPCEEITFQSDDLRLQGYLYGEGDKGLIVFAPGLSSGANDYLGVYKGFIDMGWRVFSFDTTGSFLSEGEDSVGFCQETIDLLAALDTIESDPRLKDLPLFLMGHSRGGYAVACALESDYDIQAVATISGANSPMEVTIDTSKNYVGSFAFVGYPFLYAYQTMLFGWDMTSMTASQSISNSTCPTLIIQGEKDTTTPMDSCSIYAHKEEILNPNTEYLLLTDEDQNGHTNLLFSKEATTYTESVDEEYQKLSTAYPNGIPQDIANDFYSSIDSLRINEPNLQLLEKVNDFFEKHLN